MFSVMEGVLKSVIKDQRNPSLGAMNTVWGKLDLARHVTRSRRIAGACK
jgi:hypothetical protein